MTDKQKRICPKYEKEAQKTNPASELNIYLLPEEEKLFEFVFFSQP